MKVLHVLPFPGVGGTEIATRRIADAVRGFGIESSALLLRPTDDQIAYLNEAGIPTVVPQTAPEPSFRSAVRFLLDSREMAQVCREVDLIHCADVQGAYYLAVAGRLAGRPVLSHVRNRHAELPRRDLFFINAATHFAFVSKSTRKQFALRVSDARATILYDGIDTATESELVSRDSVASAVRAELGLPPDAVIASMFARVNPQKDYETLVRAASILHDSHPRLHFVIVGDHSNIPLNRSHYAHVRAVVTAAGVGDRFVFTGFRRDARRIMLASDLCVLSTHFEGLPLVLLEAMALARPCVATAVDGVPEVLDHGVTGLLHHHEDAVSLAGGIASLLDAPASARSIGNAAWKEVQRRFGYERFGQEMYTLYARLTRRGAPRHHMSSVAAEAVAGGETSMREQVRVMPNNPSISVIIPAYNAERTLANAIRSALAQTYAPTEIIVVDDGSSDTTSAIARAMQPRVKLLQQANRGCGEARNTGARAAGGEWLAFLDADDTWLPQKLEKQLPFTGDPRVAVVNCRRRNEFGEPLGSAFTFDALWQRNDLIVSSTLVRRSSFEAAGGFWDKRACEDYHLWLRLAGNGWLIANCLEDLVIYSPSPDSLSRQLESFAAAEIACIKDVAATLRIPETQLKHRLISSYVCHARGAIHFRQTELAKLLVRKSLALGMSAEQIWMLMIASIPTPMLELRRQLKRS